MVIPIGNPRGISIGIPMVIPIGIPMGTDRKPSEGVALIQKLEESGMRKPSVGRWKSTHTVNVMIPPHNTHVFHETTSLRMSTDSTQACTKKHYLCTCARQKLCFAKTISSRMLAGSTRALHMHVYVHICVSMCIC